ncbi:FAD-binding oxidoreductase [Paramagnetospirillum kuznetsovii]|uniref:D-lactate dehydrogenase (cytochrome) n=1 Tax=Paramagnetospirillum kuznetsovii TaxID=2053833 RepID=A0A364NZH4_9PROT|nr:FAD-linked oxidase C-terminal domain-containing protein [Paramagnetospirillum kuznetsovii]RAU22443.1 FAD-binding oxidoreductase [Paramagnetospirillum kuznetsovii]
MPLNPALLDQLSAIFGDRLSTSAAVREHHGKDESHFPPCPPDAVVFALSTAEVAAAVKACAQHQTPVIAFGTGTSLEGHVAALRGGVCVDVAGMNAVLGVRPQDMDVTIQPGVTRKQLNEYLRDSGLFFPIDPGADASLGGMAATRASGTNAVRYGTMRDNVLSLEVVLPDGRVIRTASRARKSSAGYDLTRLFVGSEGTLGIITELTLRLQGIPEAVSAAVCPFPSVEAAMQTVILTIQSGIPVARIEFLDEVMADAVNRYSKTDHAVAPTLFFEFHGSAAGVREQAEKVQAIAADFGAPDFRWATSAEERTRLWAARHNAYYAGIALKPGCRAWTTDACVPISRLADCLMETRADLARCSLTSAIVGHVGDGNFHVMLLVDPKRPEDSAEAEAVNRRIVRRALAMDGTCTGEHGIGHGKMEFLDEEFGDGLDVMRRIKAAIDPQGIMNPGKIVS